MRRIGCVVEYAVVAIICMFAMAEGVTSGVAYLRTNSSSFLRRNE